MYNFYTGQASVANWAVPSPMSICFWITLRGYNVSGTNRLFGTADNFEIKFLTGSEKYQADIYASTGEAMPSSPAGTDIRLHLAITGTIDGDLRAYINGVLDVTDPDIPDSPTSPASLGVGGRFGNTSVANGDMEDIRVYNRELTAAEIKNIYGSNGRDGIVSGLINQWAVSSKGNGADIGTDYIYDLSPSRQHLQKVSDNIYYRGGFLNPRRRV